MKSLALQAAETALSAAIERELAAANALADACMQGRSGRRLAPLQRAVHIAAGRTKKARARAEELRAKEPGART